jgi:hypothetical protein
MRYRYNRDCGCDRCRAQGLSGPVILITIGVLFLLDQVGHVHWMAFTFTWPALLIVIGLVQLLQHTASTYGHIPQEYRPPAWQSRNQPSGAPTYPGQPVPPGGAGYPPQGPVTPPPPITPAGFIAPGQPGAGPDDKEGRHG